MQNAPKEHSAKLPTFIKLPFVVKSFVLSILVAVLDSVYYMLLLNSPYHHGMRFFCFIIFPIELA